MKWTITDSELTSFLSMKCKEFQESPPFYFNNIEFTLIVYPRGYSNIHQYSQIFITNGKTPPTAISTKLTFLIECTLNKTEWIENIDFDPSKELSHALPTQILISLIDSSLQHPPNNITFDINVSQSNITNNIQQSSNTFE
eukprot:167826_1